MSNAETITPGAASADLGRTRAPSSGLPPAELLQRIDALVADGAGDDATALLEEAEARVDELNKAQVSKLARLLGTLGDAGRTRAEAVLLAAIVRISTERLLVEDYIDLIAPRMDPKAIDAHLLELLLSQPDPKRNLTATLVARLGHERLFAAAAAHFEPFFVDPLQTATRRVWEAHLARERPPAEACKTMLADRLGLGTLYFTLGFKPITQIALRNLTEPRAKMLADAGIDVDRLAGFTETFLDYGTAYWREKMASVAFGSDLQREIVVGREKAAGFKDKIVQDRRLVAMDPFTGEMLAPFDSVIIFGRALYAFAGKEIFYLIAGEAGSDAFGYYIPRLNLSISFTERLSGVLHGEQMITVLASLATRIARKADAFAKAAAEPPAVDRERRIFLNIGATDNFAHHLWNFYSGVQRLIEAGIQDNVHEVHFSGTEFFGSIHDLFPEFPADRIKRPVKNNIVDPAGFNPDALVLPAGGWFISKDLTQRIVDTAHRLETPEAAARRKALTARHRPVVWLGIRLGDKAYEHQETGIPDIIERIHARYPDALFLVDGFSFPVGLNQIPDHWEAFLTRMRDVVKTIVSRTNCPDQVIDLVGNTLADSTAWAAETDVYLAPLGTTQHKVGWLTNAPGIVYAPPSYASSYLKSPGFWAAEVSPIPECVIGVPVRQGERRGYARSREKMANIDLDTGEIADKLIALLAQRLGQSADGR